MLYLKVLIKQLICGCYSKSRYFSISNTPVLLNTECLVQIEVASIVATILKCNFEAIESKTGPAEPMGQVGQLPYQFL